MPGLSSICREHQAGSVGGDGIGIQCVTETFTPFVSIHPFPRLLTLYQQP